MNIKQLADKYELTKDDFWELRKNSNKWIITHDACEKIAVQENIVFEPPQIINYTPTIITENGEKVQKVTKWGTQNWKPAWAGTCQRKSGDVAMIITGYKQDNPDYKIWTTGEANGDNCTMNYLMAMSEKRGKDRIILKLINAYEYGIYSDVEADDFEKHDKPPTEKQLDMLHNLAGDLKIEVAGVENMNRENVSKMIDDFKERLSSKKAEEKLQLIKE
jgi:hypothetical protein